MSFTVQLSEKYTAAGNFSLDDGDGSQNVNGYVRANWMFCLINLSLFWRSRSLVGALRSDNGDVHKTSLKTRLRIVLNRLQNSPYFWVYSSTRKQSNKGLERGWKQRVRFPYWFSLRKKTDHLLVLKRGGRSWVQTEMVKFISLPFASSKKLKIWSFHVVVVQERQGNLQKKRGAPAELWFCRCHHRRSFVRSPVNVRRQLLLKLMLKSLERPLSAPSLAGRTSTSSVLQASTHVGTWTMLKLKNKQTK